jgi:cation diffusion facilitator CzcD-associated flavoprotein CzcO
LTRGHFVMVRETSFLIIGAGPFGLAMAAYAKQNNIDHLVVGRPMDFWKSNMPKGMFLRSGLDWHLDPLETHTIENYLESSKIPPDAVEPMPVDFYLDYVQWFMEQKVLEPIEDFVKQLNWSPRKQMPFEATMETGEAIQAMRVLLAIGFRYFKNIPEELAKIVPAGFFSHTCDLVEFDSLKGKRCLIIGGRQSAFEWAALIHEAGAASVHVSHRQDTPAFTKSDWSWTEQMIKGLDKDPGSFRKLSPEEREEINQRFWAEGRSKLEPWLWPRINKETIKIWPKTKVVKCDELPTGDLEITLSGGQTFVVDHVVFATGYKVNMGNVPFLAKGNLLDKLKTKDGFPVLDEHFQTNIPGLFATSMAATRDFGAFFAFTVSVNASAKTIGSTITG